MDFESRRQRILDKMEDNSIAILYSGIEHHVSADEYDLFTAQANRNFFYLTGLRRDNMVLVLDKCVEPAKTMLFIEEADPTMERWYGRKVTMEEAEEISGIDEIEYIYELESTLEPCFKRLYKYYDKSAKTKAKVASAMTYPIMVIVTAIIVFAIIMVVAVPAFTSAFADLGTDLPAVTRWLMNTSAFLTHWWWLILFILALLTIGYLSFKRTEPPCCRQCCGPAPRPPSPSGRPERTHSCPRSG